MRQFRQVDVFGSGPAHGNPVAVVHDADDLDDEQMQLFAQWTNLSETTFLLRPTDDGRRLPAADLHARAGELPFAGHPTLGSAHAWLEAGGRRQGERVVQECAAGLVTIERGERLAFQAPPLLRDGPVDAGDLDHDRRRPRHQPERRRRRQVGRQRSRLGRRAARRRARRTRARPGPEPARRAGHRRGRTLARRRLGRRRRGAGVRPAPPEDPVTGSLNASLGQWLAGHRLPESYVAAQGTAIGRRGRVHVRREGRHGVGGRRHPHDAPWRGRAEWRPRVGWTVQQYLDLLTRILDEGVEKTDRTGTGTLLGLRPPDALRPRAPASRWSPPRRSTPGRSSPSCCGSCAATPTSSGCRTAGVSIWDEWADADGDLGPVYGYQWRSWPTPDGRHVDQIAQVVEQIRRNPDSRRHIVSAWNVADIPDMALAPCHTMFQFYVADGPAGCAASSTSARPTSSSACRSTSRRTPCSRTWSPR